MPTLNDVANKAGVSKSTVSRVLNNKLGKGFSVSDKVRQRVLDVANELNYRPNLIARSLTQQQTRMISVLGGSSALSDLGNIYQTVVNNFTEVFDATGKGFDVTVDMSRHKPDVSELPLWKIDGAVVLAGCNDATTDELNQRKIPHVVVNGPASNDGFSVVPNDVEGTQKALRYLTSLGHKRIAYAAPRTKHVSGHSSLKDRHDTYVSQMNQMNLIPMVDHDKILASAIDYLRHTVIENKATAILAYGHMEALNIMQAAHKLDLSIPECFSLICFCDAYASNVMSPGLTFMDLQSRQMGNIAAEMLLNQIESPEISRPKKISLDEILIVRETTAAPEQI